MPAPLPKKKGMPWWMFLVIGFGVMAMLAVIAVVVGVWWVGANKDRWVAEGQSTKAEANSYATNHDQSACLDESIRRSLACRGFSCEVHVRVFLDACVKDASKSPGLCEGAPKSGELMKANQWAMDECRRRGKPGNSLCVRALQGVPEACAQE